MPTRSQPLLNDEVYHVFNKTIVDQAIFSEKKICDYAIKTFWFYRKRQQRQKLSTFQRITDLYQQEFLEYFETLPNIVDIHCYCLMPNHFHLLLTQKMNGGISHFVGTCQNSLARFHNRLHGVSGPIFLPGFHSVHISSNAQLMHISRYIHLNPYTSSKVKTFSELYKYPWSSLQTYLNLSQDAGFLETSLIGNLVGSPDQHRQFIEDQADYQRSLHSLSHSGSVI